MKNKLIKRIIISVVSILFLVIIFSQIFYVINREKSKQYDETIESILKSLEVYKNDHEKEIGSSIITKITLQELIDSGLNMNNLTKPLDLSTNFCIINDNGEYKYLFDDGTNCGQTIINNVTVPAKSYNEYLYSETIEVNFSPLEGLEYYIKSTKDASVSINIDFACGTSSRPKSCTQIKTTKNIKANTWYRVSGSTSVIYDEHSDEEGSLYTLVTDNHKYEVIDTIKTSKIDRKSPVVVLDSPITSTNSVSVKIESMLDNETDIASSTCRYGTTKGEYKTVSMSNTKGQLSKCIINYKLKDKIYYYQVCATDKVGNVGCALGSSLIQSIENPVFEYLEDNQVEVLFGNKHKSNLKYYIKSDAALTLDIDTLSYCGKSNLPNSCIESKTKTLLPNVWYEVKEDVVISYKDSGSIYATIYDGEKYVTSSANIKSNIKNQTKN